MFVFQRTMNSTTNYLLKTNYIGRANKYVLTGNISTLSKADKDSNY